MREVECAYWDDIAVRIKGRNRGEMNDNIWKRCEIVSRILAHRPIGLRILEIGAGQGLGAAVVNLCTLGHVKYIGTDVSRKFCEYVQARWKLLVEHRDILNLPDGPFDMVWAFDTLEHVRPEDRDAGYKEIARVLAPHAMILLNIPLCESSHDLTFDFPYDGHDALRLAEATATRVNRWEAYDIPEVQRSYLWVELVR